MSPKNVEWFYTVFTPFTDYAVTNGEQCFLGLGWGDDEDLLFNFGGGTLPRTPTSVSDAQWELVQTATNNNKDSVLFTHFTLQATPRASL